MVSWWLFEGFWKVSKNFWRLIEGSLKAFQGSFEGLSIVKTFMTKFWQSHATKLFLGLRCSQSKIIKEPRCGMKLFLPLFSPALSAPFVRLILKYCYYKTEFLTVHTTEKFLWKSTILKNFSSFRKYKKS